MTENVWRAVLRWTGIPSSRKIEQPLAAEGVSLPSQGSSDIASVSIAQGKFLDSQHRYQLLDPLPAFSSATTELEARVLDLHPLQLPFLTHQLEQESSSTQPLSAATPEDAKVYLELQSNYPFLPLPEIRDAWEQDGLSVLLLKDKTYLPLLTDACQREDVLPLQILHWLHEMTEHWAVLHPHHCAYSLLVPTNLRVDDEDCIFCLQRLYRDPVDHSPSLKELGGLWYQLFEQSQRTQNGELFLLCRDLQTEGVTTIDEVQARLETIAKSLQMMPSSPSLASQIMDETLVNPLPEPSELLDISSDTTQPQDISTTAIGDEVAADGDDQPTVVLPMRLVSIEDSGRTITGSQREHNEDCFYIQSQIKKTETKQANDSQERTVQSRGLYILCDGMGGHAGGEVASALAVDTLQKYFEQNWHERSLPGETTIREGIQLANHVIYEQNQQNARMGSARMGTTLVMVLLHNTEVAIAHVGDSRLYRFTRRVGLEQMTVDHEVGQREIQRGVEPAIAYARPDAYQLTQALGPRDEGFIRPDIQFLELNEDTLLLLCSDGLTDNEFLELHSQSHLEPMLNVQTDLEQELNQLVDLANQFNGHDNITTVAIRVRVRPNFTLLNRNKGQK
ncbi:MAG: serine/threonine phosphatase [Elainellaceae cyanobacterium]